MFFIYKIILYLLSLYIHFSKLSRYKKSGYSIAFMDSTISIFLSLNVINKLTINEKTKVNAADKI